MCIAIALAYSSCYSDSQVSGPDGWLLLIHQLPARPLYLRAQVRRRLAQVGALPLKNSVYVLPDRPACLEDLQWIAQEAATGGGEASVCRAEFIDGTTAAELRARFRDTANERFAPIKTALEERLKQLRRRRPSASDPLAAASADGRRGGAIGLFWFGDGAGGAHAHGSYQETAAATVEKSGARCDEAVRPQGPGVGDPP